MHEYEKEPNADDHLLLVRHDDDDPLLRCVNDLLPRNVYVLPFHEKIQLRDDDVEPSRG